MQKRMALTRLDWDDVRLFLAVHRARTLTGAARSLGVDQSTMSRRLATLEHALGARLFDRVPGGLKPTPVADRALPIAEATEASALDFAQARAGADASLRGTVRLALPDGVDTELVVPALPALYRKYPALTVELVAGPQVVNLARREADLALRFVRPRSGGLVLKKLATLEQGVWAHRRLVRAHGRSLAALPWVTWDETGGAADDEPWLAQVAPGARIALRTDGTEARLAAVVAGVGAAVLPDPLARRRQGLVRLATPAPLPALEAWLVGHEGLVNVPRVRAVWRFVEELVAKNLA